jgi:ABC-2 type transport system permease protein
MTRPLVGKLLRDLRTALVVVALLIGLFQLLWANITARILGDVAPFFNRLGAASKLSPVDLQGVLFDGPGKVARTIIGGEAVDLQRAMDVLSIGFIHPLMQTIFCIWAIGRAAGAIAGELDRGTMELLLSQPLARSRVVLAHFLVDVLTIPVLCATLFLGMAAGAAIITPIKVKELDARKYPQLALIKDDPEKLQRDLAVDVRPFARSLLAVGGLMFAVSGYTMWLSAAGRFRWRVLGLAVLITLLMFLVNLIGQMWDLFAPLRPLTIFYYFQPQQVILGQGWTVDLAPWNGGRPLVHVPMLLVLYGVGAVGYLMALRTFCRRDLPAPL